MKAIVLVILFAASMFPTFAGETNSFSALRVGDYVKLAGTQGFLKYNGEHSGVRVCALSTDIGSAVPSEDFRLYVCDTNNCHLVQSLPLLRYKGYRCVAYGDTLSVYEVSKYTEIPNTNSTPVAVFDLSQLAKAAQPSGGANSHQHAAGARSSP